MPVAYTGEFKQCPGFTPDDMVNLLFGPARTRDNFFDRYEKG